MIRKKLLLLAACGILGLTACGSKTAKTDSESSQTKAETGSETGEKTAAADTEEKEEETKEETSEQADQKAKEAEEQDAGEQADTSSPEYIQKHGQRLKNKKINAAEQDNDSQGWGIGPDRDEYNRPVDCTTYQNDYTDYNADFIVPVVDAEKDKFVYLTFDEGYENGYTGAILDTLKEKNAKAVFFVTGPYVKEEPELVKRMIDEGHIVGNHTENHPAGGITTLESAKAMRKELKKVHKRVKKKFDYDMYLFRPPEGVFSHRSLAVASNLGYRTVLWSFAHADYEPENQPDPAEALENCKSKLCPGSIYLLHAISKTNTEILGDFIDYAREEGYEIGDYQEYVEGIKAEDAADQSPEEEE